MMSLLLFYLFLSIVFSFLCSILEAVLLSIPPSYIRKQEKLRPKLYVDLNAFKNDIDRPLSAILTLNTIAHTAGAIGVGVQASMLYGSSKLQFIGMSISVESIIAVLMTLAILILSEIIPKTIGANYWKRLTPASIVILKILIKVLGPLVWLSQFITKNMKKNKDQSVLSRADLMAMTKAISDDGVLHQSESEVINNVLNLPNITIENIMTPRTVMFTAKETDTLEEVIEEERFSQFSRIPLFDEEKEKIVGMVLKHELLSEVISGNQQKRMKEIMRPVDMVNEDELLATFFKKNHKQRQHLFIVVDHYGSVTGLVTLEDVMETILGYEILDETDIVPDLQSLTRDQKGKKKL